MLAAASDRSGGQPPGPIRSFHDLNNSSLDPSQPIITLFSGGLDSTYLLLRLVQAGYTDIHAVSIDLGEGESADHLRDVVESMSVQLHVIDGRQRFVEDFVRPAIAAQAVYLGMHPISASLSRPLLAEQAMRLATRLGASAVIHTANRSQNSLRRLNGALAMLGYRGRYGSPYELEPIDREQKARALESVGLSRFRERRASVDANLWCREFESGVLEDPEDHVVPEDFYKWSVGNRFVSPSTVEVGFAQGVPVSVDGIEFPLGKLIETLNYQVGSYGIGRYSGLEHLADGHKVLEVREMPAAWLLLRSYRHLETATLDAETIREKMHIEQIWVREALEGRWFGELRDSTEAFIIRCASRVTGSVKWRLKEGTAETSAIVAEQPRYLRNREVWERTSSSELERQLGQAQTTWVRS